MPDITLTVTNAQLRRIQEALKAPSVSALPTREELKVWIMRQVKAQVLRSELGKASQQSESAKRAELEAEGW